MAPQTVPGEGKGLQLPRAPLPPSPGSQEVFEGAAEGQAAGMLTSCGIRKCCAALKAFFPILSLSLFLTFER